MNINPYEVLKRGVLIAPKDSPMNIDLSTKECQISSNGIDLRIKENAVIPSQGFKNIEIMERFCMDGVIGAIWIRSSFSRKGVFQSSGLFDETGPIYITLNNMGNEPVTIEKGTRICQMVFFEVVG